MCETDVAILIYDTAQRHTSQLEEIDFLPVHSRHAMIGIGQTDEWKVFLLPVFRESVRPIGTDRQDLHAATFELLVLITQARQLRAAVRSHEAAQKSKDNRLAAAILR